MNEAKALLQKHRIEKLLLTDEEGRLEGLITVKDIEKRENFPRSTKDNLGRPDGRRRGWCRRGHR